MSRRNKLLKFADILTFPNVYENHDLSDPRLVIDPNTKVDMRGIWQSFHFKNENPIVVELACGGGEYTVNLANIYPDKNYIGVDLKGNRIWKGATKAISQKLSNAAFIRTRIEFLDNCFAPNEIDEIWITFPDPHLKEGKANKRLTSQRFLDEYRKFLKPGAILHLKTDEVQLYDYTLEVLNADEKANIIYCNDDIYQSDLFHPALEIKSHYEHMHLAKKLTIKYIQFTIN